jgi:hypothetical protein
VDAYRLEQLRELFPAAHMTVVHLVRNPAAAVNGLIDGWLDRGFFTHRLGDLSPLNIDGYSHLPWGRQWWNFDLPPGWSGVAERPLPEVCAYQWCAAHQAILADARVADAYIRVCAEDLTYGKTRRLNAVGQVIRQLGLTAPPVPMRPERFVMMTVRPRPGRWRTRGSQLRPVLETPAVRSMAERLGYQTSSRWI